MKHRIAGLVASVGRTGSFLAAVLIAIGCALATPARAQNDKMTLIPTPAQADAIVLGTGPLPGATSPESWYRQYDRAFARNVTIATLEPFLPDPSKATGTGVIVAPGGGFRSLSMENEGSDVARALAARGLAAFVLKYRLIPTPPVGSFERSMVEMFAECGPTADAELNPADAPPSLAPESLTSSAASR